MSLRISSLGLFCLAVCACSANETPEPEGEEIECAIGPGSEFAGVCTLEVISDVEFIIHHPDGGFRRFVWADNGVLAVADGAEPVQYERVTEASREFGLEVDRYRLPTDLMLPPSYE